MKHVTGMMDVFGLKKDDERALSFISNEFSLTPGKAIKEPVIIFPKIEYKN